VKVEQRKDEGKQQRAEDPGGSRRRKPDLSSSNPSRRFNATDQHNDHGQYRSHEVDAAVQRCHAADVGRRPVGDDAGRQHVDVLTDGAADERRERGVV